jgi:hypothetical protein
LIEGSQAAYSFLAERESDKGNPQQKAVDFLSKIFDVQKASAADQKRIADLMERLGLKQAVRQGAGGNGGAAF